MNTNTRGHVLLTGAVGGLGTAMTQRLLAEGYDIIACDRQADTVNDWLQKLPVAHRDRVQFHPLDVAKEELVTAFADKLREQDLSIAYLINNAGIHGAGG